MGVLVQQQDAPVPQRRFVALERIEVTFDFAAPRLGKWPRPRRQAKLEPPTADDGNAGHPAILAGFAVHASIVPEVTMTAPPPIDAAPAVPPETVIVISIR